MSCKQRPADPSAPGEGPGGGPRTPLGRAPFLSPHASADQKVRNELGPSAVRVDDEFSHVASPSPSTPVDHSPGIEAGGEE